MMGRGSRPGGGTGDLGPHESELTAEQEEECRDRIQADLSDLAKQEADLAYGKSQFPPDFDLSAWTEAFEGDPEDRFKAGGVNWRASTIVNDLNGVLMNGAVLAGIMPWHQRKSAAPSHYAALAKHKIISAQSKTDLNRANTIRTTMTHHYATATADDVHELVVLLGDLLPRLRQELAPWLSNLGAVS
jgi:hypothetical protein